MVYTSKNLNTHSCPRSKTTSTINLQIGSSSIGNTITTERIDELFTDHYGVLTSLYWIDSILEEGPPQFRNRKANWPWFQNFLGIHNYIEVDACQNPEEAATETE